MANTSTPLEHCANRQESPESSLVEARAAAAKSERQRVQALTTHNEARLFARVLNRLLHAWRFAGRRKLRTVQRSASGSDAQQASSVRGFRE